jgi:hypothetical protein
LTSIGNNGGAPVKWIVLTVTAGCLVAVATFARARARRKKIKVGAVSEEWVAEHRPDQYQP